MWVKWKLISVYLEIVFISTQDRCMVCTERAIGSKIVLGASDGTPWDMGQVEACFGPFEDTINLGAREVQVYTKCTTSLDIILVAPNGTPR
jgi:hypothetical protein